MLHQLNCIRYAPKLESHIRDLKPIEPGSNWEIELRGTSIWCVELIKREIEKQHPEVKMNRPKLPPKGISDNKYETENSDESDESDEILDIPEEPRKTCGINAILIDFFLYDTMKSLEAEKNESIPHHRTRSIWY
jgi:hypothetical protein